MKMIKIMVPLTALVSILFLAGCDALENFSVNVPFTVAFSDSTLTTETSDNKTYDLSENSVYNEYKEKIEDFEFLEASYFVTETVPETLTGTMKFTVRKNNEDGEILIYQEYPGVTVYEGKTQKFVLDQAQINMFNAYLLGMYESSGSTVFYGEAVVSDLEDNNEWKKIEVDLHVLLKAKGTL
jgi:uncharacterized lipoprotein YajG